MENYINTSNSSKVVKIIYRLKATKSFYAAKLCRTTGEQDKCRRLCEISLWYHQQAFKMGYDSEAFIQDIHQLMELSGKEHTSIHAAFFPNSFHRAA